MFPCDDVVFLVNLLLIKNVIFKLTMFLMTKLFIFLLITIFSWL